MPQEQSLERARIAHVPGARHSPIGQEFPAGLRILMLSYEYPPIGGGGSRVVDGLTAELVRMGHQVDLVTMAFDGLAREEVRDGVRIIRIPCLRRSPEICHPHEMVTYLGSALPRVARLARRGDYDVHHAHFIFPDGILACALRGITGRPYVVTTHGSDVPGYNPDRFGRLHRLLAPAWRRVVRSAAEIVCPSEVLSGLVRRRAPRAEPTLIPNGARLSFLTATAPKERRILTVTRMLPRKGVQTLLDAVRGLDAAVPVDVVGDGPALPALREHAARIGRPVTFHGWLDNGSAELRELYERSGIFVFLSESENFPIVLLEAMSAGMAVITTSGTGCAEVVGDTGLLVAPRDPVATAAAIRALLDDPDRCAALGRAARERVERRFAWPVVAAQYVAVYERLRAAGIRPAGTHPGTHPAGTHSAPMARAT